MADRGKQLKYESDARQALLRGIEKLSRAVNVTLAFRMGALVSELKT